MESNQFEAMLTIKIIMRKQSVGSKQRANKTKQKLKRNVRLK